MENGYSYWMNNLIGLDQQFNALLAGSCDETLSSRIHRHSSVKGGAWSIAERVVNHLFWFDKGQKGQRHCELAYMVEMSGGHMPKSMVRKMVMS